jgi:hypothetical protein
VPLQEIEPMATPSPTICVPHAVELTIGGSSKGRLLMKLHMHPASIACRPLMLFAAESNILVENEMVDILSRAHHHEQSLKDRAFVRI